MEKQIIKVVSRKIGCSGDENSYLGHPKIYLEISKVTNQCKCPYCDRTYIYTK